MTFTWSWLCGIIAWCYWIAQNWYSAVWSILVECKVLNICHCDHLGLGGISSYGGMMCGLFCLVLLTQVFVAGIFGGTITLLRGVILVRMCIFGVQKFW